MKNKSQNSQNFFTYIPAHIRPKFLERLSTRAGKELESEKVALNFLKQQGLDDSKFVSISVGTGTCGLGAGARKVVDEILNFSKAHTKIILKEVGCIGLCSEEPLLTIHIPGRSKIAYGKVRPQEVKELLELALKKEINTKKAIYQETDVTLNEEYWQDIPQRTEHQFFAKQKRLVLANCGHIDPLSINEYMAHGGYQALAKVLHDLTPHELCKDVVKSGLRGRGGGGFLTGKKWEFALNTPSTKRYFICNADEGDPGAFMDRAVIEGDPHRLLEGLIISSYAIQATTAYVYIRAEYPLAIHNLSKAIEDAHQMGFLGQNILDSNYHLEVHIKKGAGAFVCGEETALMNSIEGKRGMPRPRPPFPAVKGLYGSPTVINNVETLANLPGIFKDKNGPERFASIGTEGSKGTKVFALSGKVKRTGLVEVPMGMTMKEIVFEIGGGMAYSKPYKALQIGGPSGGCVPASHLDIQVDYESLKQIGAMMGSGGMVVMDEDNCMVDVAKFFMDFIQRESCGKCIPCRQGTKRMLDILNKITQGTKTETKTDALTRFKGMMELEELAQVIEDTSLCGLGMSAPSPVLSTLRFFRDEYEEHIFRRHCRAGACTELIKFTIDEEKCIGCTLCAKKCPTNAIISKVKIPHHIEEEKCVRCGACEKVCKFQAVVRG